MPKEVLYTGTAPMRIYREQQLIFFLDLHLFISPSQV